MCPWSSPPHQDITTGRRNARIAVHSSPSCFPPRLHRQYLITDTIRLVALTRIPRTFVYMPPEAIDDGSSYGPISSFGHVYLALFSLVPMVVKQLANRSVRDLTANNVLLTASLVAKISDLGNACIEKLRLGQLSKML